MFAIVFEALEGPWTHLEHLTNNDVIVFEVLEEPAPEHCRYNIINTIMFFITCEAGRCRDHEDPWNIIGNDVSVFSIVFDVLEGAWRPLEHYQYNGHIACFHCMLGTGGYDCVYHY